MRTLARERSTTSCAIGRARRQGGIATGAAHTIVVVAGQLVANGQALGPGGYAHFPGGTAMLHQPAEDHDCTYVLIFDGPFDLDLLESPPG